MALYKQKNSSNWWYKFRVGGQTIRESAGTTDRGTAEQVEARRKLEIFEQQRLGVRPERLWQTAVVEYMNRRLREGQTKRNTRYTLKWLDPYLRNIPISKIDRSKLIEIRDAKIADINRKKAVQVAAGKPSRWTEAQASTVNRIVGVVVSILNYAANELEWIDRAPKAPMLTVIEKDPVWATREKALRLIGKLPKHQISLVIFALEVGWRRHNVTHLEWSQVDMPRRFAWITPEAAKEGAGIPAPLSDVAMEVLEAQQNKHDHWVFPYRGRPIEQTSTRAFRRARDAAGLPPTFTWHSLRKTWASWKLQDGMPKHVLKELGGWKSDKMVAHYSHLGGEHLREFVKNNLELGIEIGIDLDGS